MKATAVRFFAGLALLLPAAGKQTVTLRW